MAYLLDTGILLRLVDAQDRLHDVVREAVGSLAARQVPAIVSRLDQVPERIDRGGDALAESRSRRNCD